jgi:hypothetical protein
MPSAPLLAVLFLFLMWNTDKCTASNGEKTEFGFSLCENDAFTTPTKSIRQDRNQLGRQSRIPAKKSIPTQVPESNVISPESEYASDSRRLDMEAEVEMTDTDTESPYSSQSYSRFCSRPHNIYGHDQERAPEFFRLHSQQLLYDSSSAYSTPPRRFKSEEPIAPWSGTSTDSQSSGASSSSVNSQLSTKSFATSIFSQLTDKSSESFQSPAFGHVSFPWSLNSVNHIQVPIKNTSAQEDPYKASLKPKTRSPFGTSLHTDDPVSSQSSLLSHSQGPPAFFNRTSSHSTAYDFPSFPNFPDLPIGPDGRLKYTDQPEAIFKRQPGFYSELEKQAPEKLLDDDELLFSIVTPKHSIPRRKRSCRPPNLSKSVFALESAHQGLEHVAQLKKGLKEHDFEFLGQALVKRRKLLPFGEEDLLHAIRVKVKPFDLDAHQASLREAQDLIAVAESKKAREAAALAKDITLPRLTASLDSLYREPSISKPSDLDQISQHLLDPEMLARGATVEEVWVFVRALLRLRGRHFYNALVRRIIDEIMDNFVPMWIVPLLQKTTESAETAPQTKTASQPRTSALAPEIVKLLFWAGIECSVAAPLFANHLWTADDFASVLNSFIKTASEHKYPRHLDSKGLEEALVSGDFASLVHGDEKAEIESQFSLDLFRRDRSAVKRAVRIVAGLRAQRNRADEIWHGRRRGLLLALIRHMHALGMLTAHVQANLSSLFASGHLTPATTTYADTNRPLPIQVLLAYAPVYALIEDARDNTLVTPSGKEILRLEELTTKIFVPLAKLAKDSRVAPRTMFGPYYRALDVFFAQGLFCAQADVSPDVSRIRAQITHQLLSRVPMELFKLARHEDLLLEILELGTAAVLEAGLVYQCIPDSIITKLFPKFFAYHDRRFIFPFILLAYRPITYDSFCALFAELPSRMQAAAAAWNDALALVWQVPIAGSKSVLSPNPVFLMRSVQSPVVFYDPPQSGHGLDRSHKFPTNLLSAQLILARLFGIPFTRTRVAWAAAENWTWTEMIGFIRFHIDRWRALYVEEALLEAAKDRVPGRRLPDVIDLEPLVPLPLDEPTHPRYQAARHAASLASELNSLQLHPSQSLLGSISSSDKEDSPDETLSAWSRDKGTSILQPGQKLHAPTAADTDTHSFRLLPIPQRLPDPASNPFAQSLQNSFACPKRHHCPAQDSIGSVIDD